MKNFVPKGKLLELNISLFLMKEIKVHTRVNIHRLRKRGSGGAGGVRGGRWGSGGLFGGDRMVFRGNGGGSVVSSRVKGGAP